MLKLRHFRAADTDTLIALFYETVHTVNAAHYSEKQLDAWAPEKPFRDHWDAVFHGRAFVVAEIDGVIAGFGDLSNIGVFDHLFVHKDFQRRGVASAITCCIEQIALREGLTTLQTEASITAKPFFERKGYHVITEQKKPCRGQVFRCLLYTSTKYMRFNTHSSIEETRSLIARYCEPGNLAYKVLLAQTGEFIGVFALKTSKEVPAAADVSLFLSPESWNLGYAGEILRAAEDMAANFMQADSLLAYVVADHIASCHTLEKAGYHVQKTLFFGEGDVTLKVYELSLHSKNN